MDENLILDSDQTGKDGLTITSQARESLQTAAKWSGFLAILGFVFVGLLVIVMLTMGSTLAALSGGMNGMEGAGGMMTGIMAVYAIVIAVVYFFPLLYLWNFSSKMKAALRSDDVATLNEAFRNLGRHYKYIGILMAIVLGLYLIIFLIAMLGMAMR